MIFSLAFACTAEEKVTNSENVMVTFLTHADASLHIETWTLAGRIKMADKSLLMITDTERAYKVSTMTKKKKFH